jgi:hypothetical protein
MEEIEAAINQEKEAAGGKGVTWADFFKTKGNRRRFLIVAHVAVGAQWSGAGIIA